MIKVTYLNNIIPRNFSYLIQTCLSFTALVCTISICRYYSCLSFHFSLFSASYDYRKMDLKKLFLCGLLIIVSVLSQTSGMPNFSHLRLRRSPQGPLSPWCTSPFLNYPFFTSRFCPPNPNCKLTVGREDRDCSKLE